jgi:hypothetical protein
VAFSQAFGADHANIVRKYAAQLADACVKGPLMAPIEHIQTLSECGSLRASFWLNDRQWAVIEP